MGRPGHHPGLAESRLEIDLLEGLAGEVAVGGGVGEAEPGVRVLDLERGRFEPVVEVLDDVLA